MTTHDQEIREQGGLHLSERPVPASMLRFSALVRVGQIFVLLERDDVLASKRSSAMRRARFSCRLRARRHRLRRLAWGFGARTHLAANLQLATIHISGVFRQ